MVTAGILLMSIGFTGCDKDSGMRDPGDWDPMEWKSDVTMDGHTVTVPPEGGTYQFTCMSYDGFWLNHLEESVFKTDSNQRITTFTYPDDSHRAIKGEWTDVTVRDNVMTVTVAANETGESRAAIVTPTAGDIFDYFYFDQPAE